LERRGRLRRRRPRDHVREGAGAGPDRRPREPRYELAPLAAPGESGSVVAALRDAARGYDALARTARRNDRQRFIAARAAVARSDAALAGALRRLRG
jgi:hypothetical protein